MIEKPCFKNVFLFFRNECKPNKTTGVHDKVIWNDYDSSDEENMLTKENKARQLADL